MQYIVENVKDFNLEHIFDCGQCFRWEKQQDGSYIGTAMNKIARMTLDGDRLIIDNCDQEDFESTWRDYLDLNRDYSEIKALLTEGDSRLKMAAEYGYGIRILNQDFWETVVSFIISQNNNIPRIKGCIEAVCAAHGEKVGNYGGKEYFAIPRPEVMAGLEPEDLASARLGYRAPYLVKTARQMLEEGGPEAVKARIAAGEDPIGELQAFCGIGPKVAACISLFGLGRIDAFPVDVWMRRVMNRLYGIEEKDMKAMKDYAAEHFGRYGGIAQQYLFYYIREAGFM